MTDSQHLLAEYARNGSDAAFRELVTRYVDLVYSTALRLVDGDTHRAEDVTQTVFVDLSHKARTLPADVRLGGWLHRDTCLVAGHTLRGERRRQSRERQAAEMNALQNQSEADFSQVAPLLDDAINDLGEADRTAILLRFFEQQDFRAVGQALGSTEDAARMRVTRALEKLEEFLKHRGVTTTAASLGVVLTANAVQAAPVGLAVTISTAAALAGTTLAATATATATKAIAMTTLQKAIITAIALASAVTPLFIQHRALAKHVEQSMLLGEMRNVPIQMPTTPPASDTDNRTRQERVEMERLRREAATLRVRIAEFTTQAQRLSAANPSQKISGTPIGQTLRLTELRDAGQATPAALLQTQMWAMLRGDTNRLAQIMAFDLETDMLIVQRNFDEMHKEAMKGLDTILAEAPLSEIRLLEEQPAENTDRWIVSEFVKKNGDVEGRTRVRVRPSDTGWKLVIGIDGQPEQETVGESL